MLRDIRLIYTHTYMARDEIDHHASLSLRLLIVIYAILTKTMIVGTVQNQWSSQAIAVLRMIMRVIVVSICAGVGKIELVRETCTWHMM
jgi:uncharacterized ion transporter superfamily protein YfcC